MKTKILASLVIAAAFWTGCTPQSAPPAPSPLASPSAKTARTAQTAKDAAFVVVPAGLPTDLNIPADNPMTADKVELGRLLYFDKRLSVDGTLSCASCHDPSHGWSDPKAVSDGVHGGKGTRHAPTIINATYSKVQFWDGRAASLEEQALGPIANPAEMGNTHDKMVSTLAGIQGYTPLFEKAFGGPPTKERVAQAIASFERTVLSGNSAYDRYVAGDKSALSPEATRGKDVFFGAGRCVTCHVPPNFTDGLYHNLGVGVKSPHPDPGRQGISKNDKDTGAFKTPGLRDIAHRAPYMHDGSQQTLEAVVEWYDKGGEANPHLDPLVTRLHLTPQQKSDLVEFMKALDGNPSPAAKADGQP